LGPVFRAYDAEHERLVAVKLFKLDLPPERVHQLVAEFEQLIAADLNHPAIAKPVATGISGVAAFLAQDYIAAESLDLAVREYGPAPAADALRVAAQLAGALDFAGVVNVHHGALHPRDVLLSPDETRLTGIGVAQALQKVGVGVPVRRPYTAPELIAADAPRGNAERAKADLFSLAALVFELLSGKRITGPDEPPADAIGAVSGADAAVLRSVFARALAERPDARFETALEFVDALKRAFPDVALRADRPAKKPAKRTERRTPESALSLPLEEPEISNRPDVEVPILETPPPDLPLAAAEEQRYVDAEVGPAPLLDTTPDIERAREDTFAGVSAAPAPAMQHEVFSSALERSRSAVWPLMLALGVGVAVGFAAGYGVGSHDRTPPSTVAATAAQPAPPAGKEFTESQVPSPESRVPTPEPRIPNPEAAASRQPPAPVNPGRLLIRSTPAGAHVTVDGKDAGVTPAQVRDLAPGAHHVHVVREGYSSAERRVVITRARPTQSLTVPLEREHVAAARGTRSTAPEPSTPGTLGRFTGALAIESRPTGARVFLDGKLIGKTPLATASVPAGEHAVRLEYDGYRRWTSSVRVVAGEQNRVTASLER